MGSLRRRRRSLFVVNVVPLVDVLITLIFFFMVSMQFRNQHIMDITPPKLETAGKQQQTERVLVGITTEGLYYFNNEAVSFVQLQDSLKTEAQRDKHTPVLVLADEDTALKYMTQVMDTTRKLGLERVQLQVR